MHRRRFVLAGLALGGATAGCLDLGGSPGSTSPTGTDSGPTDAPEESPASETPTEETPSDPAFEVLHDATGGVTAQRVEALRSAFERAHPDVRFDARPVADADATNIAADRIAAGSPPGTFLTTLGGDVGRFAGDLAAVGDAVWDESTRTAHASAVRDLCQVDGRFVGVPIGTHRVNELYYDPSVLESAGVDPSALAGVEDLFAACDRVAARTDATPLAHATETQWPTTQLLTAVLLARDGPAAVRRWTSGGDATDALEGAITDVRSLLATTGRDSTERNFVDAATAFADGGVAFFQQGSWAADLLQEAGEYGAAWDRMAFPGTADSFVLEFEGFVVPADGPRPEDARQWLAFLAGTDGQHAVTSAGWAVSTRTDLDATWYDGYRRTLYEAFGDATTRLPSVAHGQATSPAATEEIAAAVDAHVLGDGDTAAAAEALVAAAGS